MFGDTNNKNLAERLLEVYYLEDILNFSGLSEEDCLEALLTHGLIKIPDEIVPIA